MGSFQWIGIDADSNPPPTPSYVLLAPPKFNPPKAANANDGGALWWDHDDPGAPGSQGNTGLVGAPGFPGMPGGDTPQDSNVNITQTINGAFVLLIAGGKGQPGGKGGKGGPGGEGQDGGDHDDEQPAGPGGLGGNGGQGGPGGNGGQGGTIYPVTFTLDANIDVSQITVTYTQGIGGQLGQGGDGGEPGPGGKAGDNGPIALGGIQGPIGVAGQQGPNGTVNRIIINV